MRKRIKMFISYRRGGSAGYAMALHEKLCEYFRREQVFLDVKSIKHGSDFVVSLEEALAAADLLLVLIDKSWLTVTGKQGRRLDDPEDFVRREVATALRRGITVIPVLLDGAAMPDAGELPDDLQPLTRQNAIELGQTRYDHDVRRLVHRIDELEQRKNTRLPLLLFGGFVVLLSLALVHLYYLRLRPFHYFELLLLAGAAALLFAAALRSLAFARRWPLFVHLAAGALVFAGLLFIDTRLPQVLHIQGMVQDANGTPLANVIVVLGRNGAVDTTDADGNFRIAIVARPGEVVTARMTHDGISDEKPATLPEKKRLATAHFR